MEKYIFFVVICLFFLQRNKRIEEMRRQRKLCLGAWSTMQMFSCRNGSQMQIGIRVGSTKASIQRDGHIPHRPFKVGNSSLK